MSGGASSTSTSRPIRRPSGRLSRSSKPSPLAVPEPEYLLRDRDSVYGDEFRRRVKRMGMEQVVTARRSPWQNPCAERVIGSIRRECVDHMIVLGENHLRRILLGYQAYYNEARTHLSLERNSPVPRELEPPSKGRVVAIPHLGGLHHRYLRAA
jgi:transposase InsO family protein